MFFKSSFNKKFRQRIGGIWYCYSISGDPCSGSYTCWVAKPLDTKKAPHMNLIEVEFYA